jgi:hypothetical protein
VINADYYSENCTTQPLAYSVTVPKGMFYSTTSLQDANDQAEAYAQQQANEHGECTPPPPPPSPPPSIEITYTSNASADCFKIDFYDLQTGNNVLSFYINSSNGVVGSLPSGTYTVLIQEISQGCDNGTNRTYVAGCQSPVSNANGVAYISGVTISSSCKNIVIY